MLLVICNSRVSPMSWSDGDDGFDKPPLTGGGHGGDGEHNMVIDGQHWRLQLGTQSFIQVSKYPRTILAVLFLTYPSHRST